MGHPQKDPTSQGAIRRISSENRPNNPRHYSGGTSHSAAADGVRGSTGPRCQVGQNSSALAERRNICPGHCNGQSAERGDHLGYRDPLPAVGTGPVDKGPGGVGGGSRCVGELLGR